MNKASGICGTIIKYVIFVLLECQKGKRVWGCDMMAENFLNLVAKKPHRLKKLSEPEI